MAFKKNGSWRFDGIPDFRSQEDAFRYFDKENNYWVKGRYGLSGDYYKYLTMYQIRNRTTGAQFYPHFRTVDHEYIFPWIQQTLKDRQDGVFVTQRGGGKSTIFLGYLPIETAILNPGAKIIMTSEAVNTTSTNFSEKLKIAYEGLHEYYRPSLVAQWPDEKAQKPYIKFGKRKHGKIDVGSGSIIESIETAKDQKSPSKLEGQGCILLVVDELYKHPFVAEVLSRGAPLVREYKRKVGSMMMVGSLSEPTAKGLENAIEMIENAATRGISVLFVPASHFNPYIEKYDDNGRLIPDQYYDCTIDGDEGRINIAYATEVIKKNRSILEKLPNKATYYEEVLKYPLELNELLHITRDSWWTEYEQEQIGRQHEIIKTSIAVTDWSQVDRPAYVSQSRQEPYPYLLNYDTSPEIAKFWVFEEPVAGRKYGVGVDTIPFVTDNKEGSDHVALVKCFDTDQYVAMYADRSYDANIVGKNTAILQIMYNYAEALVEKNSIGALKTVYENYGILNLLAYAPLKFRPKATTIERGLNKDRNAPVLHQLVRNYLFGEAGDLSLNRGSLHLMNMRRFFDEYMKFPLQNADFLDAMAMAEALHTEYRRIQMFRKNHDPKTREVVSFRNVNGVNQMVVSSSGSYENNIGELDLSSLFKKK
jgi:hypothetical protein